MSLTRNRLTIQISNTVLKTFYSQEFYGAVVRYSTTRGQEAGYFVADSTCAATLHYKVDTLVADG